MWGQHSHRRGTCCGPALGCADGSNLLSSALRGTLQTSLNKHAQASHLLATKTSSLGVWLGQISSQRWIKRVIFVGKQDLEGSWDRGVQVCWQGGDSLAPIWFSPNASWGASCCLKSGCWGVLELHKCGKEGCTWELEGKEGVMAPLPASLCNLPQEKWVSSPAWALTTPNTGPDSGLRGDDTHFLAALWLYADSPRGCGGEGTAQSRALCRHILGWDIWFLSFQA